MRASYIATILSLTLSLHAAPALATSSVPMFRAGPGLNGVYPSPSPARLDGVRFTFDAHAPIRSSPAVVDGVLYVGDSAGIFHALDAETGEPKWRYDANSGITSSPAVIGGDVAFTTRDHRLITLDRTTGKLHWQIDLGTDLGPDNYWDFYTSSPILFDGRLYVGSGHGEVLCVSPGNGRVLWRVNLGARIRATLAVSASAVIAATGDGHLVALDPKTGNQLWSFASDGAAHTFETKHNDTTSIYGSPSIDGDTVVFGSRDAMLYAVDMRTGQLRWKTTHDGDSWILSTAADGSDVYSGSGSAYFVQRANLADGKEIWHAPSAGANFGSMSIAGNVILFNDFTGKVYAVAKDDGKPLWTFTLGDRAFANPVAIDGTVYVSSDAGVLYALKTSTGGQATRRLVYAATNDKLGWFQNGVDTATLAYFKASGYEAVDDDGLKAAMAAEIAGTSHAVVVLANDRLPEGADLRAFFDAGGDVVVTGPNPVTMVFDPATGELADLDASKLQTVLGITPPAPGVESGYHVSKATDDGRRWGLDGYYVSNGGIAQSEANVVLGVNEFGTATDWVKFYGPRRGELITLALPRNKAADLAAIKAAVEHGLWLQSAQQKH